MAVPPSFAYKVGFREKDFIPVKMNMNGAEGSTLGVIGAILQEFTYMDASGARHSTRQLCYMCEKISREYFKQARVHCLWGVGH